MQITDITNVVNDDFSAVNALIGKQLSSDVPLVEKIGHYIVDSGGKRMRPLLVLLTAGALDYQGEEHIKLAAIIEFLHTATLLHDDVVDTSSLRRGKATANAQWGNAPSVLVGDFLYSRAFQMMVELRNMDIMDILSHATNVIAEGEVFQLMNCKNPDVSESAYFEVIKNKTAMLFEAASHSAAALCQAPEQQRRALAEFGLQLGLAFQLIDDVLDYTGDAATMGKNVGDDLAEGKPTLPLIYTLQHGSDDDKKRIRHAIRKGDASELDAIAAAVQACGALDYTRTKAEHCCQTALESLSTLKNSHYKDALAGLAKLSVDRNK
ncbi:MAG: octaprenyl diphosphate synthase [Oleiphilaceae bacterium]|nr:octaprenyl diphosphate synthase [Oleiphilaceae bacterium]